MISITLPLLGGLVGLALIVGIMLDKDPDRYIVPAKISLLLLILLSLWWLVMLCAVSLINHENGPWKEAAPGVLKDRHGNLYIGRVTRVTRDPDYPYGIYRDYMFRWTFNAAVYDVIYHDQENNQVVLANRKIYPVKKVVEGEFKYDFPVPETLKVKSRRVGVLVPSKNSAIAMAVIVWEPNPL
jgi:hypothetical protein